MLKQKKEKEVKRKQQFHIKKDDLVEVNTGEEKGRRGRVLQTIAAKQQVLPWKKPAAVPAPQF